MIVVRNVGLFADLIPFLNQIEGLFAGDHYGEFSKEYFVELIRILGGVFIDPLIFTTRIHGLQSFEYSLASFFAKVVRSDEKVGLEVFFSDQGVIVDGYIDTGKDEVFGKFGIDSIRRSYEDSEGKQSESMREGTFFGFRHQWIFVCRVFFFLLQWERVTGSYFGKS